MMWPQLLSRHVVPMENKGSRAVEEKGRQEPSADAGERDGLPRGHNDTGSWEAGGLNSMGQHHPPNPHPSPPTTYLCCWFNPGSTIHSRRSSSNEPISLVMYFVSISGWINHFPIRSHKVTQRFKTKEKHSFILVYLCVHIPYVQLCEEQRLTLTSWFFPYCGTWELNSGCQACRQHLEFTSPALLSGSFLKASLSMLVGRWVL